MVVALRKNLILTDSDDTFVSDLSGNFKEQYDYISNLYPDCYVHTLKPVSISPIAYSNNIGYTLLYEDIDVADSHHPLYDENLQRATYNGFELYGMLMSQSSPNSYAVYYINGDNATFPSLIQTGSTSHYNTELPCKYLEHGSSNLSLYDVLKSFASYVTLITTGLPTGASIEWFLPEGNETDAKVDVIKGSLVPYVVTFADTSKYIGYYRANEDWIFDCTNLVSNTVILTINPTPSDATVVLEVEGGNPFDFQQVGNSITVSPGTKVRYTVSKTDYITQSNIIEVNETQTVNITLSETLYTYIIHPTPADATVVMTASGYTQLDNSISVPRGTTVTWSVSANNYVSQSGTKVVNDNCADNISLKALVEFTVTPTPNNATVTLIATGYTQVGNSIKVPYGTTVMWMVEKTGYTTRSGSKIMTEDTEAQIILTEMLTLTIVPSPNDAIVHLTAAGYIQQGNSITVPYGTAVEWEVSKEGMGTKQGRKIVTRTEDLPVELSRYVTLTIAPSPDTATVELTADGYEQEGKSITVLVGTRVHWKVYKSGYLPQSDYIVVDDNDTLPVTLTQAATLTINPTPYDSIVTLTAEGYGQYGNKITVPLNTRVYWSVVKTGYISQYGHEDMSADLTKNITLVQN